MTIFAAEYISYSGRYLALHLLHDNFWVKKRSCAFGVDCWWENVDREFESNSVKITRFSDRCQELLTQLIIENVAECHRIVSQNSPFQCASARYAGIQLTVSQQWYV